MALLTKKVDGIEQPTKPAELLSAIVCLSGGMDSATLLWYLVEHLHFKRIGVVIFEYAQSHKEKECKAAADVWSKFGSIYPTIALGCVNIQVPTADFLSPNSSALFDKDIPRKESTYTPQVIVPGRNFFFTSLALAVAIVQECYYVAFGPCKDDYEVFPDCRQEFIQALDSAASTGYGRKIMAPFVHTPKSEIIRKGLDMGVPYALTWSCYVGGDTPCRKCSACVERERAFAACGQQDPLLKDM